MGLGCFHLVVLDCFIEAKRVAFKYTFKKGSCLEKLLDLQETLRMFAAFHVAFVVGSDNAGSTTSNTAFCNGPEIETHLSPEDPRSAPPRCVPAGLKGQ